MLPFRLSTAVLLAQVFYLAEERAAKLNRGVHPAVSQSCVGETGRSWSLNTAVPHVVGRGWG